MSGKKTVQKTSTPKDKKAILNVKYDKNINKKDEFILRIFERLVIRILDILEQRRP